MKRSAGILLYKRVDGALCVLLAHPGGPFWAKKDLGAWTIPKGEFEDEEPLHAARREFQEETGIAVEGDFIELSPCRQKGDKVVYAWAVEGDLDTSLVKSNLVQSRAGSFPEIDRAEWFSLADAARKINPAQVAFLNELQQRLSAEP